MPRFLLTTCIVMLTTLTGCATPGGITANYHDANMNFGLIQSLAVLPFENLTQTARAAERTRDVFMTMLQATEALYVIPPGEVARGISRLGLQDPTNPTAEEVIGLARNLEADVLLTGTVLEYGQVRSGSASANVISVSVEMMEGQTGRIVWSASATRGGVGASKRLFGGGGEPMNDVTSKAVGDLLDALFD